MSSDAQDTVSRRGSPAIALQSIGKCYRIYRNPQDRFKQALLDQIPAWGRWQRQQLYREHWALRNISFELAPGEALGVVGRNGAGKSTLLQVIAGTLDPTEGTVHTSGRITALLELGSGFNFEFTGRENVFLNAQILGLSRDVAAERFDEIARFADIGDFIDQPIKIYSSGMVMRLAFAVQTVLEPSILIVDEALAVGDARFQVKCFRKIRQMRERGVAILLVSHDMNAIISFCDRAILLDAGEVVESGAPPYVAKRYMELLYSDSKPDDAEGTEVEAADTPEALLPAVASEPTGDATRAESPFEFGTKTVEILAVGITDRRGRHVEMLTSGEKYRLTQRVVAHADVDDLATGFLIRNRHGIELFGVTNKTSGVPILDVKAGQVLEISIWMQMWLSAGEYVIQAANAGPDGVQYDCRIDALQFSVIGTPQLFTTSLVNLVPEFSFKVIAQKGIGQRVG